MAHRQSVDALDKPGHDGLRPHPLTLTLSPKGERGRTSNTLSPFQGERDAEIRSFPSGD